jgi:Bardet-Biedl syndrome 2 protein
MLNFNRKVSSIARGNLGVKNQLDPNQELLIVGTQSNLLAYDVERNADVFFRDVPDGVNSIAVGKIASGGKQLVLTGGNCSILGFDNEGDEAFWTVTSDNVSSLAMNDLDRDGSNEIIVGSDDFEIRIFRGEEMASNITEVDKIVELSAIEGSDRFAYSLVNGSVGVYGGLSSRVWRVKTKHKPVSIMGYDVNGDGIAEIISGWSNGGFNVRNGDNGEVLFRANFKSPVASVVHADYKMDGKEEIIIITDSGEMKGYLPADAELTAIQNKQLPSLVDLDDSTGAVVSAQTEDQLMLNELQSKKLELMKELKHLENSAQESRASAEKPGALPVGTHLSYSLVPDPTQGYLGLSVSIPTEAQIVNVVAIDSDSCLFDGTDIITICNSAPTQSVVLPLRSSKYQGGSLQIQVNHNDFFWSNCLHMLTILQTHISLRSSLAALHVFEASIKVPKFAAFKMVEKSSQTPNPTSEINFAVSESINQLLQWLTNSFVLTLPLQVCLSSST